MGSRRSMTRSQSGNGTVSGSSRSPGCSYISNVRPENRSTLCSVIAQLTEETQPFFEITLKSKAVSENCNVKFTCVVTGHPTPQVTWYKDDIQLDRYCGLPKYEIFRNGQNHSLHVYNCTVEDAAIYQASAANTKGIVSCSGVLEVGEMNEFKIHQRYFSKLKLKAENKRREAEEKENQEPVRTISPDRAQRKRRSTVGGYISAPNSTEDSYEESQRDRAAEEKPRIQETTVEENRDTNDSPLSNSQDAKENCPKSGTHIYDSAQKIFTALQPKSPFFKKMKISNTAKVAPKENKSSVAAESTESQKKSEGSMEVESSRTTNSGLPSFKSLKHRVTSIGGKQGASQEKSDHKALKEKKEVPNGSLSTNSSPLIPPRALKQQQHQPMIKEDTSLTPYTKVTDRDKKLGLSGDRTPDTACDGSAAPPQPPCQRVRDQLSQKDTSPDQKRVREPEPVLPREAPQAHAKTQRNDAPVVLELQPKLHTTVAPEKTPAERTTQGRRGPSLPHGLQKAFDKTTQDTCNHSMGSSGSVTGLFTDTQKPPLESPVAGKRNTESNVSPTAQQSQLNTPIKTVEGTKIQLDEKVKGNEMDTLIAQLTNKPPSEESKKDIVEEKAKVTNGVLVDTLNGDRESTTEKTMKMQPDNTALITEEDNIYAKPEFKDFQNCPSPIPTIISIAELLRLQINALEKALPKQLVHMESTEAHTARDSSSTPAKKTNTDGSVDKSPPQTIKETLMQIYNELIKTKELFEEEAPSLSNCVQHSKLSEICPSVSGAPQSFSNEINGFSPIKRLSETVNGEESKIPLKVNGENPPKDEPIQSDIEGTDKLTPEIKVNSEAELEVSEIITVSSVDKAPEFKTNISGLQPESLDGCFLDSVLQACLPQKETTNTEETVNTTLLHAVTPESSPLLKKRDNVSIPSATPQELASGARRKILTQKTKQEELEPSSPAGDLNPVPVTVSTSPRLLQRSALLQPDTEQISAKKKRSPLLNRKKSPSEVPTQHTHELQDIKCEEKPANQAKNDPFKAPQVIRKIRGENFTDHSGHLKLWCQFFNVLSESTVTWLRDESTIATLLKSAGDETQVNLALAQVSCLDSGVYGCTITNEYGTDSTDFLLSAEVLAGMSLREDLGVGEEIEMTPLIFNKGVADSAWGNKLFGRIMVQETCLGVGLSHKTWRAKVIYGLEPVFESGNTCIIKVCNPIAYGGKGEGLLIEKNQEVVKQGCKIQNMAREYCKIFSAEARAMENFGSSLEVIPVYLMYRPANSIPYATVEADLTGVYNKYSALDYTGRLEMRCQSEVEQKCCALQHWIFQWTSGNMLFTKLEGVDNKITNVGISVKFTGHQGLSLQGNPQVFEHFVSQHQCNYFCGLLGLRSLKVTESLLVTPRPKGYKSPIIQRKMATGSSSPQTGRRTSASPRVLRKMEEEGGKTPSEPTTADECKDKLSNNL